MQSQTDTIQYSTSLQHVWKEMIGKGDSIDVIESIEILYAIHQEYGERASLPRKEGNAFKPFAAFLDFVQNKTTLLKLNKYSSQEWQNTTNQIINAPEERGERIIHGRLFLIALLLYSFEDIDEQLQRDGQWRDVYKNLFLSIEEELLMDSQLKMEDILYPDSFAKKGWIMTSIKDLSKSDHESYLNDIPNHSDAPAIEDYLSRKPFAAYLANRLRTAYNKKNGAFFMLLDGAWGSGKSTVLYFLEKNLEGENESKIDKSEQQKQENQQQWVVVRFNAWENQRLDPPWWFLLTAITKEINGRLFKKNMLNGTGFYINEKLWNWKLSYSNLFWSGIIAFLIVLLLFLNGFNIETLKQSWVAQLLAIAGIIWATSKKIIAEVPLNGVGSKASQNFIESHGTDPMGKIKAHYNTIVKNLEQPLAIFIDDLDRCNQDYGIKLIEGLQTIFKDAPVTYIIAADSRWISTMYEKQYNNFASVIGKPTKPFGLIFLDKIFQFTVKLPEISAFHKKYYWQNLLLSKNIDEVTELREKVMANFSLAKNENQRLELINNTTNELEKQMLREEVVKNTNIQKENREIENKLLIFRDVVDPNPRAIKRLLNDIGTAKAISLLYNQHVEQEQLVLWKILQLEHPNIANYLWDNPKQLDKLLIAETSNDQINQAIKLMELDRLFSFSIENETHKIDADFLAKMKFQNENFSD